MIKPPYPSTRDTGHPWLEQIPAHWDVKRLKYVASINPESFSETTEPDYVIQYLDISNVDEIEGVREAQEMRFGNAPSRARRIVRSGDTIISTVRTYLKAVAYFEKPTSNQVVSTGFAVLRPRKDIQPKFLSWLVQSKPFIEKVVVHSVGVGYPAINPSELASLKVWLPPLLEQRTIAAFLDRQTAKIDALIAKKLRLLDLLAEQRSALISQAVTKGLNLGIVVKEGNRWIDKYPKDWVGLPLKRWVSKKITDGPHETPVLLLEGITFVSAEAVYNGRINFESKRAYISVEDHKRYSQKLKPQRNDIFMVKSGATTGKLAIVDTDIEFNVWSPMTLVRVNGITITPRFMFHALNSDYVQNQVKQLWTQGTQPNISMGEVENIFVVAPLVEEQEKIVVYLDQETKRLDGLKCKVETAIERLREYRSALISSAVTGKLQVNVE